MAECKSRAGAFTLVELLVSMAVLILLLAIVAQMMTSASATITSSRKYMDADSQARMIFDRIAADLSKLVKRADVDYIFDKQNANDSLFFYSEAPGYFDSSPGASAKSPVSLVGYRINSNNQLERLGKGLTWDGAPGAAAGGSPVFLTFPDGSTTPDPLSTIAGNWPALASDSNYHILSSQTYRLEIAFLIKPFTEANGTVRPAVLSNTPWDTRQGHTTVNGLQDVSAIVVAIAILDDTSRKIVNNTSQMVGALPDSTDATPIAQTWADSNYLTDSGLIPAAAGRIRIYQRYFPLDNR